MKKCLIFVFILLIACSKEAPIDFESEEQFTLSVSSNQGGSGITINSGDTLNISSSNGSFYLVSESLSNGGEYTGDASGVTATATGKSFTPTSTGTYYLGYSRYSSAESIVTVQ